MMPNERSHGLSILAVQWKILQHKKNELSDDFYFGVNKEPVMQKYFRQKVPHTYLYYRSAPVYPDRCFYALVYTKLCRTNIRANVSITLLRVTGT